MTDPAERLAELAGRIERLAGELDAIRAEQARIASELGVAASMPTTPASVPEPTPAPPTPGPDTTDLSLAEQALVGGLANLATELSRLGLATDPADTGFLDKVAPVLEQAGPARPERLRDIAGFLDRVAGFYLGRVYEPLQEALAGLRGMVAAALAPSGWQVLQTDTVSAGAEVLDLPVATPVILAGGLANPAGTVIAPARAARAPAQASPVADLAWGLVEELYGHLAQGFSKQLKADIAHVLTEVNRLATAGPEAGSGPLRLLLNNHTRWLERADTMAAKAVTGHLQEQLGLRPMQLAAGTRFDPDQHSHKRYECLTRRDPNQPAGTIVGLRQLGFLDAKGLVVQKCICLAAA